MLKNSSPAWSIVFARSAGKELQNLDASVSLRLFSKIEKLQFNPRPAGCKKLAGHNTLWRIRVGNYRVVYTIDDACYQVDITIIRHRSKAYEGL